MATPLPNQPLTSNGQWPISDCDAISSGDTSMLVTSTILGFLMTPGLGFFYGGLVQRHSVISIIMQSFVCMSITAFVWVIVGFSLAFGESGGSFIGSPASYPVLTNLDPCTPMGYPMGRPSQIGKAVPGLAFAIYQMSFAMLAPAIITGSFAERVRFPAFLIFVPVWILVVYCPFAHWIWSPAGFLNAWGVKDFSGAAVVHITSGFAAISSLFVVGSRRYLSEAQRIIQQTPHNRQLAALGATLVYFGFFGFTGGAALASGGISVFAVANTIFSVATAMITWLICEWICQGMPSLVGVCLGLLAGLSTITASAGFVRPWAALLIGFMGSSSCYFSVWFVKEKLRWDDALDVWGVHGVGGLIGMISVGVFADSGVYPGVGRSWDLLGRQIAGALLCATWSFTMSILILLAINMVTSVVPSDVENAVGLDKSMHGAYAYDEDTKIDLEEASRDLSYHETHPKILSFSRSGPTAMELDALNMPRPVPFRTTENSSHFSSSLASRSFEQDSQNANKLPNPDMYWAEGTLSGHGDAAGAAGGGGVTDAWEGNSLPVGFNATHHQKSMKIVAAPPEAGPGAASAMALAAGIQAALQSLERREQAATGQRTEYYNE